MDKWLLYGTKTISKVEDLPNYENLIGFVYKITNIKTGKFYIGKKQLKFSRKTKISKKEKLETGTRKRTNRVHKESDWLNYWGSCKPLTEDIKSEGTMYFKREILELCCTLKYLNYCEFAYQIKNDVLTENSYNGNILGRYFTKDMENCNE
jgi:hypothetical protein